MDEENNLIDTHIQEIKEPTPNAETARQIGAIGTSSDPITAINAWIKTSYDRRDRDQVMYIIEQSHLFMLNGLSLNSLVKYTSACSNIYKVNA